MDLPIGEITLIVAVIIMTAGYLVSNWMKMKNGYPLENSWGKAVYPKNDQAVERVKLLTQENAELRAELGSIKDRMANVERIVTDSGYQLTSEIEQLRDKREAN
ncbi:hypothetical protein K3152_13655 [Qipengyuania sp. 1NDH17]|uniref:Uncharacterized protein n=2 Tax=Qipengyuania polymorpha TaxID=2867234 RepID=A0ABS7J5D9_9SPHN|nr:hypothetical protein [Qipengyuania polymorpha]MBX7459294.1 hypothetical protein [Qipengyuania polymorpha]